MSCNLFKDNLKAGINALSSLKYIDETAKTDTLACIDLLQELQTLKLNLQDFNKSESDQTLIFDYANNRIECTSGTPYLVSNPIYLTNINIQQLYILTSLTNLELSISPTQTPAIAEWFVVSKDNTNFRINKISSAYFKIRIKMQTGTISNLFLTYESI